MNGVCAVARKFTLAEIAVSMVNAAITNPDQYRRIRDGLDADTLHKVRLINGSTDTDQIAGYTE